MLKWIGVAMLAFLALFTLLGPVFALVGDLNGDGVVDIRDVAIVSKAYGSFLGHPRWNPIADVNNDLYVDVRDVAMVSRNFGSV